VHGRDYRIGNEAAFIECDCIRKLIEITCRRFEILRECAIGENADESLQRRALLMAAYAAIVAFLAGYKEVGHDAITRRETGHRASYLGHHTCRLMSKNVGQCGHAAVTFEDV
jgi:hypothetical protein